MIAWDNVHAVPGPTQQYCKRVFSQDGDTWGWTKNISRSLDSPNGIAQPPNFIQQVAGIALWLLIDTKPPCLGVHFCKAADSNV